MNVIICGALNLQHRTPAGRMDQYSDAVLDKLSFIVTRAKESGSPLVFTSRFVDVHLDRSLYVPLMSLLKSLPEPPVVMMSKKFLNEDGELPVSHPLSILEVAGFIQICKFGHKIKLGQSISEYQVQNELDDEKSLSHDISSTVLLTSRTIGAPEQFCSVVTNNQNIAGESIHFLPDVGRIKCRNEGAPYVLSVNLDSCVVAEIEIPCDPSPFMETEEELARKCALETGSGETSSFAKMLIEQKDRQSRTNEETEIEILNVIQEMTEAEEVSHEAMQEVVSLFEMTSDD